jgi:hypothetical protein
MKYRASSLAGWLTLCSSVHAFAPSSHQPLPSLAVRNSAVLAETVLDKNVESLTNDLISNLRFRAVRRELERRALDTSGTLSEMKKRLRKAALGMKPTIENVESTLSIKPDALDKVRISIRHSYESYNLVVGY